MMKSIKLGLAAVCALAAMSTMTGDAEAAPAWVRGLTIIGIAEADGTVQARIVRNGTIEWLSIPSSSSMAQRWLASVTAAYLAGKRIDVHVDLDAAQGCAGEASCENVRAWYIHN